MSYPVGNPGLIERLGNLPSMDSQLYLIRTVILAVRRDGAVHSELRLTLIGPIFRMSAG